MEDSAIRRLAVSVVAQAIFDVSNMERDSDEAKEAAAWLYLDAPEWLESFGVGADIEHSVLVDGIREYISGGIKHQIKSLRSLCGV